MAKKEFKVVKTETRDHEVTVTVNIPDKYLKRGCGTVVTGLVMQAADKKGYKPSKGGPKKQSVKFVELIDGEPCTDLLMGEHDCENKCPQCGARDDSIEWEIMECDTPIHQKATCKECGCVFEEVSTYAHTTVLEKGTKK